MRGSRSSTQPSCAKLCSVVLCPCCLAILPWFGGFSACIDQFSTMAAYGVRRTVPWLQAGRLQLVSQACLAPGLSSAASSYGAVIRDVGADPLSCTRGFSTWWQQAAEVGRHMAKKGWHVADKARHGCGSVSRICCGIPRSSRAQCGPLTDPANRQGRSRRRVTPRLLHSTSRRVSVRRAEWRILFCVTHVHAGATPRCDLHRPITWTLWAQAHNTLVSQRATCCCRQARWAQPPVFSFHIPAELPGVKLAPAMELVVSTVYRTLASLRFQAGEYDESVRAASKLHNLWVRRLAAPAGRSLLGACLFVSHACLGTPAHFVGEGPACQAPLVQGATEDLPPNQDGHSLAWCVPPHEGSHCDAACLACGACLAGQAGGREQPLGCHARHRIGQRAGRYASQTLRSNPQSALPGCHAHVLSTLQSTLVQRRLLCLQLPFAGARRYEEASCWLMHGIEAAAECGRGGVGPGTGSGGC